MLEPVKDKVRGRLKRISTTDAHFDTTYSLQGLLIRGAQYVDDNVQLVNITGM